MNSIQHCLTIISAFIIHPLISVHSIPPTPSITPLPTLIILPTIILEPTATPAPTKKPQPTKTPTPSPTPYQLQADELDRWFTAYSSQYSIDRQRLRTIAVCESNLRPNAQNGIYGGLYQFDTRTWISTRKQMNQDTNPNLRFHPEEAIKTAAFLLSTRGHSPWKTCTD